MPDWFAIFETANGRLESLATIKVDPLPPSLSLIQLSQKPDDGDMWDEGTLSFVARPAKILLDRFDDDLLTHPKFSQFREVYDSLSNPDKTKVRNAIRQLLGQQLIRNQNQSVEIGIDDES